MSQLDYFENLQDDDFELSHYLRETKQLTCRKVRQQRVKNRRSRDHISIVKRSGKRDIVRGLVGKVRDAAEDVGIVRHPLLRVGDEGAEPPSLSAAGGLWQIFLNFQPFSKLIYSIGKKMVNLFNLGLFSGWKVHDSGREGSRRGGGDDQLF